MRDARRGVAWRMPEAGRIDEIEPILQVARRHANLYVLGGVAEDHAPSAELVVDRQLPDTPERSTRVGLPEARQSLKVSSRALQYRTSNSPESLTSTGRSSRCPDSTIVESLSITLPPLVLLRKSRRPLPRYPEIIARGDDTAIGLLR
jgi:hypothetical protein